MVVIPCIPGVYMHLAVQDAVFSKPEAIFPMPAAAASEFNMLARYNTIPRIDFKYHKSKQTSF